MKPHYQLHAAASQNRGCNKSVATQKNATPHEDNNQTNKPVMQAAVLRAVNASDRLNRLHIFAQHHVDQTTTNDSRANDERANEHGGQAVHCDNDDDDQSSPIQDNEEEGEDRRRSTNNSDDDDDDDDDDSKQQNNDETTTTTTTKSRRGLVGLVAVVVDSAATVGAHSAPVLRRCSALAR